jgi:hypothetical protein
MCRLHRNVSGILPIQSDEKGELKLISQEPLIGLNSGNPSKYSINFLVANTQHAHETNSVTLNTEAARSSGTVEETPYPTWYKSHNNIVLLIIAMRLRNLIGLQLWD